MSSNLLHYIKDDEWRRFIGNPQILVSIEEKLNDETLPGYDLLFNAFNLTPMNKLKVVILCEKPYVHESIGCSLIVDKSIDCNNYPQALKNVIDELRREYPEFKKSKINDLTNWCREGVLLLNMILTCDKNGGPMSHADYGWDIFIKDIIVNLDNKYKRILFVTFGSKPKLFINKLIKNNVMLSFAHPYYRFSGNDCFKLCNDKLIEIGLLPVRWWNIFENETKTK